MLGKRRSGFLEAATSRRSPLELNMMKSPRGLKNYDLGGVGLGIVAALKKSCNSENGREILAKYAVWSCNLNRSNPKTVNSNRISERLKGAYEEFGEGSSENYTYVTCHGPNKSFTKVYYDGVEYRPNPQEINDLDRCNNLGIAGNNYLPTTCGKIVSVYPTSDFLSSCHLCRKNLHGKDIYMYR